MSSCRVSDDLIKNVRVDVVDQAEIVLQGTDNKSLGDSKDIWHSRVIVCIGTDKLMNVIKKREKKALEGDLLLGQSGSVEVYKRKKSGRKHAHP